MESTYKTRIIDRDSVVIDEHTKAKKEQDKNIIYAPGWSITDAFDDDQK